MGDDKRQDRHKEQPEQGKGPVSQGIRLARHLGVNWTDEVSICGPANAKGIVFHLSPPYGIILR